MLHHYHNKSIFQGSYIYDTTLPCAIIDKKGIKMFFIYDDSFLTEEEIEAAEEQFWHKDIQFSFGRKASPTVDGNTGVVDTKVGDVSFFTTNLQNDDPSAQIFFDIIRKFTKKHGIEFDGFKRLKLNIMTPTVEGTQKTLYPHIDYNEPHYIFLYYPSDSDGDTIIYNERHETGFATPSVTVNKRISPKKGAAFIVDGRHFHSITTPAEHPFRGVVNSNLIIKDWPTP